MKYLCLALFSAILSSHQTLGMSILVSQTISPMFGSCPTVILRTPSKKEVVGLQDGKLVLKKVPNDRSSTDAVQFGQIDRSDGEHYLTQGFGPSTYLRENEDKTVGFDNTSEPQSVDLAEAVRLDTTPGQSLRWTVKVFFRKNKHYLESTARNGVLHTTTKKTNTFIAECYNPFQPPVLQDANGNVINL